jgi:hypothetical protein
MGVTLDRYCRLLHRFSKDMSSQWIKELSSSSSEPSADPALMLGLDGEAAAPKLITRPDDSLDSTSYLGFIPGGGFNELLATILLGGSLNSSGKTMAH